MDNRELLQVIQRAAHEGITELDLSGRELTALPPEIGQLTRLTNLVLMENSLTTLPPEIVQLTRLQSLYLSNNQLTTLPPEITQLTSLLNLDLNHNPLTTLPPEIGQLTHLQSLYLDSTSLTALPTEIGQLTSLQSLVLMDSSLTTLPPEIIYLTDLQILKLRNNQLTALPSEIGQLVSLQTLELRNNQLTALPPEIGQLTNLQSLELSNNQLAPLLPEIGHLTSLQSLYLDGTSLTALPPEIVQLIHLHSLDLSSNQLTILPPEITQLTCLQRLYLSNNQLTTLPPEIGQLTNLQTLYLSRNELTALPPEIGQLTSLQSLVLVSNPLTALLPEVRQLTRLQRMDLSNNRLVALPPEIGQLISLQSLDLRDNQLTIPPEILEKTGDPKAIINYYLEHLTAETRPLNEAKMLLVGQGGVGKTSLVRCLMGQPFDEHEGMTRGIDIYRWPVAVDREEIQLNVWDFGGQEIMHATHQFFLTKRSLYLLVLDARLGEEENRVEYWLKIIQSFGRGSPVILVGNKVDHRPLDINRSRLRAEYPNIVDIVETSCPQGTGIEDLRATIAHEVNALEHVHDQLVTTWFEVKAQLEEQKEEHDYIPYEAYVQMCQDKGIDDERSQHTLIGFLHDLGVVLNYRDDPRLEYMYVLNPEWVTNGVYLILNDNALMTEHKGILDRRLLSQILSDPRYPTDKQNFIVDMMRKFELCFDLEGPPNERFLIPDLLPRDEPFTGEWDDALAFQYHYTVLPNSIISRFIVRMSIYIHQKTYWRTGVVLAYEGNKALVRADHEDRAIDIRVDGAVRTRRTLLAIVRSDLNAIHKTITGIQAEGRVPVPGHPEIPPISYQHLLRLERAGITEYIPEGLVDLLNVKQLLDGVESPEGRRPRREAQEEPPKPKPLAQAKPPAPQAPESNRTLSQWTNVLGWVLAALILMTAIAIISVNIPWYVLPIALISSLLFIVVIGAIDLTLRGKVEGSTFQEIVVEVFRQLPLLRSFFRERSR